MVMAVHGYLRTFFGLQKIKPWTIVHAFWPETETFDFGKKGYHRKGHLKRSRMVQISAPYGVKSTYRRGREREIDLGHIGSDCAHRNVNEIHQIFHYTHAEFQH